MLEHVYRTMKRPYISISGTLDELILMEAILAYYYDVPNERWNNIYCDVSDPYDAELNGCWIISYNNDSSLGYFNHSGCGKPKRFKASQLTQILKYIEEHERS